MTIEELYEEVKDRQLVVVEGEFFVAASVTIDTLIDIVHFKIAERMAKRFGGKAG